MAVVLLVLKAKHHPQIIRPAYLIGRLKPTDDLIIIEVKGTGTIIENLKWFTQWFILISNTNSIHLSCKEENLKILSTTINSTTKNVKPVIQVMKKLRIYIHNKICLHLSLSSNS